ncbi:hypothetical protein Z043_110923 [Scleropages formosus]|uniref:Uncharacterized protein n=1 Tax=Scleropages formosus TaxID=113540 RepID=A0A0P7X146_SCLFO|nr:hypothetical protein Z043_110923 [Scleropages formosus]
MEETKRAKLTEDRKGELEDEGGRKGGCAARCPEGGRLGGRSCFLEAMPRLPGKRGNAEDSLTLLFNEQAVGSCKHVARDSSRFTDSGDLVCVCGERAARAFGEYLSHSNPENRNGSDHLLSDTFIGQDSESPDARPQPQPSPAEQPGSEQPQPSNPQLHPSSRHSLSLEHSFSIEEPESKPEEGALQSPKVYTITGEGGMLGDRASQESLELEVLKVSQEPPVAQLPVPSKPSLQVQEPRVHHHHAGHHRGRHHRTGQPSQPLQSSGSAHNIRDWGVRRGGSRDDCSPDCEACRGPPSHSHRSLDLETCPRETSKARKKLERMYSEDRMSGEDREDISSWFPKENMFSFQTATTTMQA